VRHGVVVFVEIWPNSFFFFALKRGSRAIGATEGQSREKTMALRHG
jgi:hypothetical protein